MDLIIRILIYAVAVMAAAYVLPGVRVRSFGDGLIVGILLLLVNATIRPILVFLTIPATILTLGLFLFVINAFMVWIVHKLMNGFHVRNFWWAMGFSIILSVIDGFLRWILI
ncbi:phage holin family protein [Fulvivirga sedimenti]|uniref:Phage holin family protein n=1 Tax=Fulvivirga sedimenti TaxID=2879465 RepID=A0A9X1HYA7_9BACT|nr:phage holin family protein [Fulvivirga sedimenti]MCA6079253.1 phage holin family protein [Fulvivirga sedimenti]